MNIDRTISFRQDMIDLILAGKKTVTIRPIKPQPEMFSNFSKGCLSSRTYWEWKGYDLSRKGSEWFFQQYPHGHFDDVMTIRERPETKLKIISIDAKRFEDVSNETWKKDGAAFEQCGLSDQVKHWESFYRCTEFDWMKNPWVWVIEFELEKKGQEDENCHRQ